MSDETKDFCRALAYAIPVSIGLWILVILIFLLIGE